MTDVDVRSFVAEALVELGADVSDGDSVVWVRAPERLQSALRSPENFPLAFDPDHAGEFGADLIAPGSFVLERLLSLAMERGRWDSVRVSATPKDWVSRVLADVGLQGIGDSDLSPMELRDSLYFVFTFRLTFLSDEKREAFHAVVVSAEEGIAWPADLSATEVVTGDPVAFAEPPKVKEGYEIARAALREITGRETRAFRERSLRLLEEEVRRIFRYCDETMAELREADPSKAAEIGRSIEAQRGRHLTEALERFEPRATAALCAVRAIVAPTASLEWRGAGGRRILVDAWTKRVRGLICDRCHADDSPWSCAGGELLCARCTVTQAASARPRGRPRSGTPRRDTRIAGGSGRSPRGSTERPRAASGRRRGP